MVDQKYRAVLEQGLDSWNQWRKDNPTLEPDLSNANFSNTNLSNTNLSNANLSNANLSNTNLSNANLSNANLSSANLSNANLSNANLSNANLSNANLSNAHLNWANLKNTQGITEKTINPKWYLVWQIIVQGAVDKDFSGKDLSNANLQEANFTRANLSNTNLQSADLTGALLLETNLEGANLESCRVYGISVWKLQGTPKSQLNLIVTPSDDTIELTVDNLKIAQFIYLIYDNKEIREVIDSVISKIVLILGRFTEERKPVW